MNRSWVMIDVALHALDLGHVGDAPGAVAQAREVHDEVDGRGHLLADDPDGQVEAGHQGHGLDTATGCRGGCWSGWW